MLEMGFFCKMARPIVFLLISGVAKANYFCDTITNICQHCSSNQTARNRCSRYVDVNYATVEQCVQGSACSGGFVLPFGYESSSEWSEEVKSYKDNDEESLQTTVAIATLELSTKLTSDEYSLKSEEAKSDEESKEEGFQTTISFGSSTTPTSEAEDTSEDVISVDDNEETRLQTTVATASSSLTSSASAEARSEAEKKTEEDLLNLVSEQTMGHLYYCDTTDNFNRCKPCHYTNGACQNVTVRLYNTAGECTSQSACKNAVGVPVVVQRTPDLTLCQKQLQVAKARTEAAIAGYLTPECLSDGRFKRMQCDKSGSCWCVDTSSGIEIYNVRGNLDGCSL